MTARARVGVDLAERSYEVHIGAGLLGEMQALVEQAGGGSSLVVIADSTVADLYGRTVLDGLGCGAVPAHLLTFPAGEEHKNLVTYARLMDALFALRPAVDRDALVLALGGGVTGDVAGFVAATALRGMRFVQCPTTLLAAVDASVGGKTGIDHAAGKNLIGSFHQPGGVWIDVETLGTLPLEQVRSGLAECVKHGIIRDATLLDDIEEQADDLLSCRPDVMTPMIARNVGIKAAVVTEDEREGGRRADLNFGHTIGHAIETLSGFGAMTHGQAVALGMVAENHVAFCRGLLARQDLLRVERLLARLGLGVRHTGLDWQEVWAVMQHDKKARAGKVRMVLATGLGTVEVFDDTCPEEVAAAVEYLASPAGEP